MVHTLRKLLFAIVALASAALVAPAASAQGEQERLVTAAEVTFANFMRDPEMTWLRQNMRRARAVLIAPEIVRAGFIFGGSGGRAVLFARESGQWRGPAFYTLATGSVNISTLVNVAPLGSIVFTAQAVTRGDASGTITNNVADRKSVV